MVIIIGAGLSGLITAYRLKNEGIPFKVLEARDRIGGRIHTLNGKNNTPLEMGATWFNSQHHNLIKLLKELDIAYFKQYMKGTAYYQRFTNAPVEAINIPQDEPSYRVSGGTSNLINTLYKKLDEDDVLLNQSVKKISYASNSIIVEANESYKANKVVLALPPKLWANTISFEPKLPTDLLETAKHTHTWMEDASKAAVVYDRPFWRDKNESGTFFSNVGPVTEFYDHCNADESKYSLCGFIIPNDQQLSFNQRKEIVINQLKQTFGEEATLFTGYEECNWREEEHTYTLSDAQHFPHQNNGHPIFSNNQYENRLIFSSTEVSPRFGGYMEGAVYSANETVKQIVDK